jgi:hypothetical protein
MQQQQQPQPPPKMPIPTPVPEAKAVGVSGPVEELEMDKKGATRVLFVFKDPEDMSMEERRAMMPKYVK